MRIEAIERRSVDRRARIQARFVYEDVDMPPCEVFYEVDPPLADALEATPDAFAMIGYPLAQWVGERRLSVEGALDTALASGLRQAGALLSAWYEQCGSLALEPSEGYAPVRPRTESNPVALFSGGVDAMAMLCENRRLVPPEHPRSIGTLVYGFGFSRLDHPEGVESDLMRARHEAQAGRIAALCERLGITFVRLDTNVRRLHPGYRPFYDAYHSAALLAPLVASPGYVSDALIASCGEGGTVRSPHGSHPMLDVHYSTNAVRVHHVQPQFTRMEKVQLIADWEPAYDTLVVCHGELRPPPEQANCGRCEKCVRTMIALAACQALQRFTVFPTDDVTPEMIHDYPLHKPYAYITEPDVLAGLERAGRTDLILAIEEKVKRLAVRGWERRIRKLKRSISKRLGVLPGRAT